MLGKWRTRFWMKRLSLCAVFSHVALLLLAPLGSCCLSKGCFAAGVGSNAGTEATAGCCSQPEKETADRLCCSQSACCQGDVARLDRVSAAELKALEDSTADRLHALRCAHEPLHCDPCWHPYSHLRCAPCSCNECVPSDSPKMRSDSPSRPAYFSFREAALHINNGASADVALRWLPRWSARTAGRQLCILLCSWLN